MTRAKWEEAIVLPYVMLMMYNPCSMSPARPPDFASIADARTRAAFRGGKPEVVQWLAPSTKLFKWTHSITTGSGVSPWWHFLQATKLPNGCACPGIMGFQALAARAGVPDRDYARARAAVTFQWNKMTTASAISLLRGAWGYIGRASGQLRDANDPQVYFIGGAYQVWIPGLLARDIVQISIVPYLTPNATFGAR